MNCEKYREAIAADPSESFEGGAAHSAECPSCTDFKAEMQALDARIAAALAIDVPQLTLPELPATGGGDGAVELASRRRPGWSAPAWIGLAASVVIAAVIGGRMLNTAVDHDSLAEQVIAHLDNEPQALIVTNVIVSDETLRSAVAPAQATVSRSLGLITYARTCEINGRDVPHLVVQGEKGPVTILLMPEEKVDMPIRVDGKNIEGVIVPVGEGSIAIIGVRGEPVEQMEKKVSETVNWRV
jgi:anti-sigma factor RsiW